MPSYIGICNHKHVRFLTCYLVYFITLKFIVFKNLSQHYIFAVFCSFRLIVTEPYFAVIPCNC